MVTTTIKWEDNNQTACPTTPKNSGGSRTITPQQVVEQLSLEDRSRFSIPKFSWPWTRTLRSSIVHSPTLSCNELFLTVVSLYKFGNLVWNTKTLRTLCDRIFSITFPFSALCRFYGVFSAFISKSYHYLHQAMLEKMEYNSQLYPSDLVNEDLFFLSIIYLF